MASLLRNYFKLDEDEDEDVIAEEETPQQRSSQFLRAYYNVDNLEEEDRQTILTPSQKAKEEVKPEKESLIRKVAGGAAKLGKEALRGAARLILPKKAEEAIGIAPTEEENPYVIENETISTDQLVLSAQKDLVEIEDRIQQLKKGTLEEKHPKLGKAVRTVARLAPERLFKTERSQKLNELLNLEKAATILREVSGHDPVDKGFFKGVLEGAREVEKKIPFTGSVFSVKEMYDTKLALEKEKAGMELTPYDKSLVTVFNAKEKEKILDRGIGYMAGQTLAGIPTFAIEFMATSGAFSAGKAITMKGAEKVLLPKVAAKVAAYAIGSAAQTGVNVPRLAENTARYMLPEYELTTGENGEAFIKEIDKHGDTFEKALAKSFGTTFIEFYSERAGGIVEKPIDFLKRATLGRFIAKNGMFAPSQVMDKLAKGIGWNGMIAEVFEEEFAELGQAPIEGREIKIPFATPEGTERLLVETLGIGAFAGISKITDITARKLTRSKDTVDFENKDVNQVLSEAEKITGEPIISTTPSILPPVIAKEFAKGEEAQPTILYKSVAKGTSPLIETSYDDGGAGVYLGTRAVAEGFEGELNEIKIKEGAKLLDLHNPDQKQIYDQVRDQFPAEPRGNELESVSRGVSAALKDQGYDGVIFAEKRDGETLIFDPSNLEINKPIIKGKEITPKPKAKKVTLPVERKTKLTKSAQEAITTIKVALSNQEEEGAVAFYKEISKEEKLPPFKEIKASFETEQEALVKAPSSEKETEFGQYQAVAKKMKRFLRMAADKKSRRTGELFREHIPVNVFGVGSDEIATDLGISENELMAQLLGEKAPSGFASTSPYADLPAPTKATYENINPVEFPELLRIAKELMGTTPSVKKKLPGARGRFYPWGEGKIKLLASIFEDSAGAAKTLAHEIGHLIDYLPDKTMARGNLVGRIMTLRKHLKRLYGDLDNKMVRQELWDLSVLWHPEAPEKWRKKSTELYADAVSVLFNDPALLKEKAPTFWRGFFDHLNAKPEVKDNFFAIQSLLNRGEKEVLSEREQDIRTMFKNAEDQFRIKVAENNQRRDSIKFRLKYDFIDRNQAVIDKVNEAKKKGTPVNDDANPIYWLEEMNYLGGVQKSFVETQMQPIYKDIMLNGVTWEDFGEVLFLERVINERGELANPLGYDPKTAQKQLDYLKTNLGKKWAIIERNLPKFREAVKSIIPDAEKAGLYTPEMIAQMKANPAYATYQVIDYIDTYISASVKQQIGTLKEIANPASSTLAKTLAVIRAIERTKAKNSIINFMKENFPDEIIKADTLWSGKAQIPIDPKEVGLGMITTVEGGKLKGYYVDEYIASTMEYMNTGTVNAIVRLLKFTNSKLFRPLFITFNLGFQSFNLARDFFRFYKNTPNMPIWRAAVRYGQALKPAFARAWQLDNATIQTMEKAKILSITFNDIIKGLSEEDKQVDYIMGRVGLSPLTSTKKKFFNPFTAILGTIEKTGNLIETLPKVAAYKELNGKLPTKETASFIRTSVGSPDFLRRGAAYKWYNELFLFSNAIKEGIRSDLNVAFKNPKTRAGYWWKTAWLTLLPKMVMFAALYGAFGDKIREMLEDVSEYDKANYTVVPLGKDENNLTAYLRVPQDETSRVIGGVFWKALNLTTKEAGIKFKDVTDILSYTGGQIPSVTPVVESIIATGQFLAGQNPYDFFRGRNVIPDEEFKAGGKYSLKPFVTWQLQNLGLGTFWKIYTSEQAPENKTWGQKVLEAPVLSNTLGRWIKISNYGQKEKNREILKTVGEGEATRRLEEKEIIKDYVKKYNAGEPSIFRRRELERQLKKDVLELAPADWGKAEKKRKSTDTEKKFRIAIIKGEADTDINSLIEANSNEQKLQLLRQIKSSMSDEEFLKLKNTVIKEKIVSKEVFKDLKKSL